jgi:hypothetical protein
MLNNIRIGDNAPFGAVSMPATVKPRRGAGIVCRCAVTMIANARVRATKNWMPAPRLRGDKLRRHPRERVMLGAEA